MSDAIPHALPIGTMLRIPWPLPESVPDREDFDHLFMPNWTGTVTCYVIGYDSQGTADDDGSEAIPAEYVICPMQKDDFGRSMVETFKGWAATLSEGARSVEGVVTMLHMSQARIQRGVPETVLKPFVVGPDQHYAHFRNYHHDDDDKWVLISAEEYEALQKDESALGQGNWTPLASTIYGRDAVPEPDDNLYIEIAVC